MSETLLEIEDLSVVFGKGERAFRAVDQVSMSLSAQDVLAVVGESGSGKSVTMMALMGLLPSTANISAKTLRFNGMDLQTMSKKQKRQIIGKDVSMIFQDAMTSLNPSFTVEMQITEVLKTHLGLKGAAAHQRCVELLELVEIPDAKNRLKVYPHQLSGGMRQRIMIAMALSCNPEILIADEPTTALDVTVQAQILELINKLQRELGMAVIMITHDLGVIAEVSTRVAVMYASKVAEYGNVDQIFYNPKHPYTISLLNSIPKLNKGKSRLATIEGNVPAPTHYPKGCHFCTRCTFAIEKCWNEEPPVVQIEPEHTASCWRVNEIDKFKEQLLASVI